MFPERGGGGGGRGQLMEIRAEIGMPSFFLQSGDTGIGRVERSCGVKARGSDHVGEPKRSWVDDSLCCFLVVEMPNAHI